MRVAGTRRKVIISIFERLTGKTLLKLKIIFFVSAQACEEQKVIRIYNFTRWSEAENLKKNLMNCSWIAFYMKFIQNKDHCLVRVRQLRFLGEYAKLSSAFRSRPSITESFFTGHSTAHFWPFPHPFSHNRRSLNKTWPGHHSPIKMMNKCTIFISFITK